MNVHYSWWVPCCCVLYSCLAYVSYRNNVDGGYWYKLQLCMGLLSTVLWATVARVSKDILFDDRLYGLIICIVGPAMLIFMGCGKAYKALNWVGLGMAISGVILMNWRKG